LIRGIGGFLLRIVVDHTSEIRNKGSLDYELYNSRYSM